MTRSPALIWILAGLLAFYLLAPFAAGMAQIGTADWGGTDLPELTRATEISVVSATLATGLVALGGIPLGFVLARSRRRGMAALGFAVQLPLALPPLVSGVLLLFLLGYASPIGRLTQGALTDSFSGIVLAEAFVAAPFLIIAARSAFSAVDPTFEEMAASLGHRPGAVFRRVSLPLSWRPILAGLLMAWLRAFGEFGATVMVAYHPYSLPVFTYVAFGSQGLPAMLPVLLPTIGAAVVAMAVSQAAAARPGLRATPRPEPPLPPFAPASGPSSEGGPSLVMAAHARLPGFELRVDWKTSARRLAILGASGSGKSLTLRMIAGLHDGAASRIVFGDQDLAPLPPFARGIAYLPQNYGLLPQLTVFEQIRFATDFDPAQAQHWSRRLDLDGLERRRPHELSLGQQQRVALGRALSRRSARLLLLDEPFSALDAPLRARLGQAMLVLQGEMKATTILVTHDPAEAMLLADELLLLDRGQVLQAGPVTELFSRPASEVAARLLGADMIGEGMVSGHDRINIGRGVQLRVAGPALTAGLRVGWAARPHQIRLGSGREGYRATLLRREPVRDGQRRVTLRLGDNVLSLLADPACPAEGDCTVWIDPAALQVWPKHETGGYRSDPALVSGRPALPADLVVRG